MANSYLHRYRTLYTKGYHGHGLEFSPLNSNILAVVGAENYGIRGSGSLILYDLSAKNPVIQSFKYIDAIFDVSWSRLKSHIILTCSGDGFVQIWSTEQSYFAPLARPKIHSKEVSSIEFSYYDNEYFTTSSWDSTVTVCEINTQRPVGVFRGHQDNMVYEAKWSQTRERTLATVAADGKAVIWSPFTDIKPDMILPQVNGELLACDWSYADPNILVTASTGAIIYVWDLRSPYVPLFEMRGHENAIRKARFSPYSTNEVISVSYDFTTRLWDVSSGLEVSAVQSHSEFVYGVDYSILRPGLAADCSWDQRIQLYRVGPYSESAPSSANSGNANRSGISSSGHPQASPKPLPPLPRDDLNVRKPQTPGTKLKPLPPTPPRNSQQHPPTPIPHSLFTQQHPPTPIPHNLFTYSPDIYKLSSPPPQLVKPDTPYLPIISRNPSRTRSFPSPTESMRPTSKTKALPPLPPDVMSKPLPPLPEDN